MIRRAFHAGMMFLPLAAFLGSGCTGANGNTNTGGSDSSGMPCDVEAIVKARCQSCHAATPVYGAPMPLMTQADFQAAAKTNSTKKVYELSDMRIHNATAPMPPPPNMPLDAMSLDTFSEWLAKGAPAEQEKCDDTGGTGANPTGLSCTPDTQLRANAAYTMPKNNPDQYVCFGVDVPVSAKRHITAIAPTIDNDVIVHHMLLFSTTGSNNPAPTPCLGQPEGSRLLSVWAPGGQALELPTEAGMPMEGTAHFLVQVHYSNLMALDGQTDSSGFDMCTTDKLRPNDADVLAFGTVLGINVPAHGSQDVTCKLTVPSTNPNTKVYGIMPHMHKLGTIISGEVQKKGGTTIPLTNRNPWDFDTQYWDKADLSIGPDDIITTRCAWDNPSDSTVKFGEKTSDEMCFVFASYYPRLPLPNWELPALSSTCSPTP